MIYIKKDETSIMIPKYTVQEGDYSLIITNKLSNKSKRFDLLEDTTPKKLYFTFEGLDFSELENGECEYKVINEDGRLFTNGLLVVGDYVKTIVTYEKENTNIIYER